MENTEKTEEKKSWWAKLPKKTQNIIIACCVPVIFGVIIAMVVAFG